MKREKEFQPWPENAEEKECPECNAVLIPEKQPRCNRLRGRPLAKRPGHMGHPRHDRRPGGRCGECII